ncbi:MAG: glycosyltransferase [Actinobacteria bacterium]|nr:glycosyltransferase [Actinomycetota bacterium]
MRVAVISLHASPLLQPGEGDSGGMGVFIRSVWRCLASHGVAADVFTRWNHPGSPTIVSLAPGVRLIPLPAGPKRPIEKEDLLALVPEFTDRLLESTRTDGRRGSAPYSLVHGHYWLSGLAGARAAAEWDVPLVASFHTLARVKNAALAPEDRAEPVVRVRGEDEVVEAADRVVVPSVEERANLVGLYRADPERVAIVPPGIDSRIFRRRPGPRLRRAHGRMFLFVGRLLRSKGVDVAVRAFEEATRRSPDGLADARLFVVGGDSANASSARAWLTANSSIGSRVVLLPAQPHERLVRLYQRATAVLMPSRSESFGLVALEAQACGTPVIAAAVGGLRSVVRNGRTGFLIEGHDPSAYADRMLWLASNSDACRRLSLAAMAHARGFSWQTTAIRLLGVYRDVIAEVRARPAGAVRQ